MKLNHFICVFVYKKIEKLENLHKFTKNLKMLVIYACSIVAISLYMSVF